MPRRIELALDEPNEWVSLFDSRDSTLFVASDNPPDVSDVVRVDLVAGKNGPRVILRGQVIARREENEGPLKAGCVVALSPFEREKINYLNGFIRGGLLDLRTKVRIPVRLPVTYGGLDGPCSSYTRDINIEGMFVVSEKPLPEESHVNCIISFPNITPVNLTGIVSHTVLVEDEDTPGMGIIFNFSREQIEPFQNAIVNLRQSFATGVLPEEYLI